MKRSRLANLCKGACHQPATHGQRLLARGVSTCFRDVGLGIDPGSGFHDPSSHARGDVMHSHVDRQLAQRS